MTVSDGPECILRCADGLGESPLWSPGERALYWIDVKGPTLHRLAWPARTETRWTLPCDIGSIGLRRAGGLLLSLKTGFAVFDPSSGTATPLVDPEPDKPDNRLNDGKGDRQGRFWCGSMRDTDFAPVGTLYRLDPDRRVTAHLRDIRIPNALAWSPDGRTMYFADSLTRRIDRFDYDPATGAAAGRRVFAEVPPDAGVPDGATVDAEGCVWVAHMDGWRVVRYDPAGKPMRTVRLPVQRVTAVAFGGEALDVLFVTTASRRLSEAELKAQPFAGGLFAFRPGVRGIAETPYAG